jgi:hypothetical protein
MRHATTTRTFLADQLVVPPERLSREHERARRRLLQVQDELAMLDQGELWHPLSEDEYRDLLLAEIEDLEAAVEAIEAEWYG